MQDKIFDILLQNDDITWKTLIYDLVKSEEMDPWDIDVTLLSQRFITVIKEMQENDLKISGKMLLAAAILLKMKSAHLIDHDIALLDQLINETEEEIMDEVEDWMDESGQNKPNEQQKYKLIPRNPQPRDRKVSIHDLVDALQKAMESKRKILQKYKPVKFSMPDRKFDIMEIIRELYNKITYYSDKEEGKAKELTFTKLLPPRPGRLEKVYTFIPMLHLDNQRKINTRQEEEFGEIYISLMNEKIKKGITKQNREKIATDIPGQHYLKRKKVDKDAGKNKRCKESSTDNKKVKINSKQTKSSKKLKNKAKK
ncbi:MAG: ScpA family protein [archaeon]|nr:segregation/condensation protein A [Nanoarchaeota archaeon]